MGLFDTIRDTVDDAVDEAEEVVEEGTEAVGDVVEGAQEAAGEVAEGAGDVAEEVSEGDVGGAVDEATETAGEVGDTASETAGNVVSGSSDSGSDAFSGGGGSSSGGGRGGSGGSPDPSPSSTEGSSPGGSGTGSGSGQGIPPSLDPSKTVQDRAPQVNETEARDRDIINNDFATDGGMLFENPAERELSNALNPGTADTINEQFNQRQRRRNAETYLNSRNTLDRAQESREELENQLQNIKTGPSRSERLESLRDRKQDILQRSEETGAVYDISGLNQRIDELESSEGLYTVTTTNSEGEQVTRRVSKQEALSTLQSSQERLNQDIENLRGAREESLDNLFSLPEGDQGPAYGKQSFADLAESNQESPGNTGTTYRRYPNAVQEINQLQEQLSNSVMGQEQRQEIRNRIDSLQRKAQQPAEMPGGTDIPGQSYNERLPLPEQAQDNVVWTAPNGPVEKFGREVSQSFQNFQETPEARNVEDVELSNDLLTQVGAGVDTLTSKEGWNYLGAALVPGGTSPEEVAEKSIERRMNNPQSGPGRLGEAAISSPAGLVATGAAGKLVGAGTKAASVIGGTRAGYALKAAGAGLTGYFVGTQGQKASGQIQKGQYERALGTGLQTVGELGAFSKGYRSFQKYDRPRILRTTVSEADNTLRKVDDELVGAGTLSARTNYQRGPFSRKVLGRDEVGTVETDVNYRVAADRQGAEAQGDLTQEIPDTDNTLEKDLQAKSIVVQSGDEGNTFTRDIVRTEQEGRLFRTSEDFTDTTVNRRVARDSIDTVQLRNDRIVVPETGDSFVNPGGSLRGGVRMERPVNGRVSRYESFSLSDRTPRRETFGESRNLVLTDEAGGSVGRTAGGGSGSRYRFQESDEGLGQFGEPVNREGVRELSERSAREALDPDTGTESFYGAGTGSTAEGTQLDQEGQRTMEAQGDLQSQFQDRNQGQETLDTDVRNTEVQVQDTQSNLESVERTQASSVDYQEPSGGQETQRISRVRDQSPIIDASPRSDTRTDSRTRNRSVSGLSLRQDQRPDVGQDMDQGLVNFQTPRLSSVSRAGVRSTQVPRLSMRTRQAPRSRLSFVSGNVSPPRGRGGGGFLGIDFGGFNFGKPGESNERSSIRRGDPDATYDIIGAQKVESSTDEQAVFEKPGESQYEKENRFGAFTRNKPVQAEKVSAGGSTSGSTDFF